MDASRCSICKSTSVLGIADGEWRVALCRLHFVAAACNGFQPRRFLSANGDGRRKLGPPTSVSAGLAMRNMSDLEQPNDA